MAACSTKSEILKFAHGICISEQVTQPLYLQSFFSFCEIGMFTIQIPFIMWPANPFHEQKWNFNELKAILNV